MQEPYFWNNRLTDENGKEETTTSFKYRKWWMEEGCPPIREVCEHFNRKSVASFNHSHVWKYGWRDIEVEAVNYYHYLHEVNLKKKRVKVLTKTQKENEQRLQIMKRRRTKLLIGLGELENPITHMYEKDPNINEKEAWAEIYEIDKRISQIEKDLYSSYRISEKVTDKHRFEGVIENTGNLTLNQNIVDDGLTEEEREQKYEAEFTRLLQEATRPAPEDAQDIQGNNNR